MSMKWYRDDLTKYKSAKKYIDTAIIPVQAFQITEDESIEQNAFYSEVLSIYTNEIEKELSGRVLLLPTYTYLKSANIESEVARLNEWIEATLQQPFKELFVVTFDINWKKVERKIDGNLLWLPGMKETDLQSSEAVSFIRNQVSDISELIRSYW